MTQVITPKAQYGHIPGLDGLRAIAVLIVMVAHVGFSHIIPGGFGVTVFFFISGFLITRLLLAEMEAKNGIGLKNFYIRRFLRLLPALYVMMAVTYAGLAALGAAPSIAEVIAGATYTMNYFEGWRAFQGLAQEGPWGHLWSLAVEEHFYLMFPLLLVVFRKNLKNAFKACIAICIGALLWRLTTVHILDFPMKYPYVATEARLDSIVYGCALTLYLHLFPEGKIKEKLTGLVPTLLASAVLVFCFLYRDDAFRQTFRYSLQGLAIGVGILNLYFYRPFSKLPKLLEISPLRYTGKISYGLYLWHIPVFLFLDQYTPIEVSSPLYILLAFAFTYLVSGLSFRFVEQPIIGLRRKFGSHVKKEPSMFKRQPMGDKPVDEMRPAE